VIPNGVMNDFARYWGFKEGELEQTVDWLKKGRVRAVDLGCIRYTNKLGERCHRYFLNCVNIGLIASIMNLRRQTRRVLGSRTLSFVASFLLMIFQRMEYKMDIKINADRIKRKVMTVCVGSARGYGQTPNAVPYNGMLDVSVVYHPEVTQLFEGFYLFLRGKFLNHHSVHPYRTTEIEINEAQRALIGIDGRLMNTPEGPFKISIEQEVINFIIPE
jgi:diacylglycerol kinase family enzyme